jgi:hypothetical protein
MPRTARACSGGYTYHDLKRGNARATVFHEPDDNEAFIEVMAEASVRIPMLCGAGTWVAPGAGTWVARRARSSLHPPVRL